MQDGGCAVSIGCQQGRARLEQRRNARIAPAIHADEQRCAAAAVANVDGRAGRQQRTRGVERGPIDGNMERRGARTVGCVERAWRVEGAGGGRDARVGGRSSREQRHAVRMPHLARGMQRAVAVEVCRRRVCARREQRSGAALAPRAARDAEGRASTSVRKIDGRVCAHARLYERWVACRGCAEKAKHKRIRARHMARARQGYSDKDAGGAGRHAAPRTSRKERSSARVVGGVWVGARLQQQAHEAELVARRARRVQRAAPAAAALLDVSLSVHQEPRAS
eukprot:6519201-Prymnesium_polylepis.2